MKTMKELFEILLENGKSGNDCMIVTVTKSSGSAPAAPASRMIVLADGTSHGTIGGGSIEYEATKQAILGIRHQTSFFKSFVLRQMMLPISEWYAAVRSLPIFSMSPMRIPSF